jgi:hypothetical protein
MNSISALSGFFGGPYCWVDQDLYPLPVPGTLRLLTGKHTEGYLAAQFTLRAST